MCTDTPAEKPCVVCEMDDLGGPVETTNRALFNVNNRYTIEPMCEQHDTEAREAALETAYDYGGPEFVLRAIDAGVFNKEHLQ